MKEYTGIYKLVSDDLTGLGGPMGTERVTTNWIRYYSTFDRAKEAAEKDYNQSRGAINWQFKNGEHFSGDLGYVAYTITEIQLEA